MREKELREEDANIVSLNVGGAGFATSRSTLMKVSTAYGSYGKLDCSISIFGTCSRLALC